MSYNKSLLHVSLPGSNNLIDLIDNSLREDESNTIAIASAFVSFPGFQSVNKIVSKRSIGNKQIIIGTCNGISHPKAIQMAIDSGWRVRLGRKPQKGIFHPKIILCGKTSKASGDITMPTFCYVGSSNLTKGGLGNNIECGQISRGNTIPHEATAVWTSVWQNSIPVNAERLTQYAEFFARRNRARSLEDLSDLELDTGSESGSKDIKKLTTKKGRPSFDPHSASVAWVGLESFTGEYQFQVEYPRIVADIARRMINESNSEKLNVYCPADGKIREMSYKFYEKNGMFRLNIPNDVPGVDKARIQKAGIATLEQRDGGSTKISLQIIPPSKEADMIVSRSSILGNWGSTSTRFYGWY